jgi:hypothetical protein
MAKESFGEQVTGVKPPRSFILDASVLTYEEEVKIYREDIKRNRIVFEFPNGVNQLDLLEECRALTSLEDFDTMFDLTMQMLVGKDLSIQVRDENGGKKEMCRFVVTDQYQDLRAVEFIDQYPILVTWLTEFIAGWLLKKFPEPGRSPAEDQAQDKKSAKKDRTNTKGLGVFRPRQG